MSGPRGGKYGIEELRDFSRFLSDQCDVVGEARRRVQDGRVPDEAWGTVYTNFLPDVGKEPAWHTKTGERVMSGAMVRPDASGIKMVKDAYEAAHEAALGRLMQLWQAYLDASNNLDTIADLYEKSVEEQLRKVHDVHD